MRGKKGVIPLAVILVPVLIFVLFTLVGGANIIRAFNNPIGWAVLALVVIRLLKG